MKSVETFKNRESASEARKLLTDRGIESHLLVDPLDANAPALGSFSGVALVVPENRFHEAQNILSGSKGMRRAG